MKLKDIFNIDLSTRGGAKLYRKIMGKYNIPKQDSKQLVKEIRNSSEGVGVKEYYYKFNYNTDLLDSTVSDTFILVEVLYNGGDKVAPLNKIFTNYGVEEPLDKFLLDQYCVAIKILDSEVTFLTYDSNNPFIVYPKGSIVDKLLYLAKKEGLPEDQIEGHINAINNVFVEITKEEYESMITYKPE